jgi:hypothetical protein
MNDLERLVIEAACTRLIHAYCRFIDFGEAGRVGDLFSVDGVWEGADRPMEGRAAIVAGFAPLSSSTRRVMRHLCTNVTIDVVDADEARGLTYWVNYRGRLGHDEALPVPSGPPAFAGEYHDRFIRTADGWRIAHRKANVAFANQRPSPPASPPTMHESIVT